MSDEPMMDYSEEDEAARRRAALPVSDERDGAAGHYGDVKGTFADRSNTFTAPPLQPSETTADEATSYDTLARAVWSKLGEFIPDDVFASAVYTKTVENAADEIAALRRRLTEQQAELAETTRKLHLQKGLNDMVIAQRQKAERRLAEQEAERGRAESALRRILNGEASGLFEAERYFASQEPKP
jgi:hypothetical protein